MKLIIALVFAASLCRTLAFPNGASPDACSDLTPQHGANTPRPAPSSNSIDISVFAAENATDGYMYVPGATYSLMLTSTGTFRGFLIQARTLSGTMVGQFSLVANETDVRLSSCDPSNIAVTHTDRNDKTYVEFMWTAPSMDVGGIQFHYTTVREFAIFWVDETTETIFGPEGSGSSPIAAMSVWSMLTVALTVAVKQLY